MTLVILITIGFLTWREKEDYNYSCHAVSTRGPHPFTRNPMEVCSVLNAVSKQLS